MNTRSAIRKLKMNSIAKYHPPATATELEAEPKASAGLPQNSPKEISNLPGPDFTVTQEILINNVCRICATYYETGPELVPLYTQDSSSQTILADIANDFLPIKLEQGDGLPKVACATCNHDLRAWRRMYDDCNNVQKALITHAERTSRIQYYSVPRPENGTIQLHIVDLTDSDSESDGGRWGPAPAPPTPPDAAPGPSHVSVFVMGPWTGYTRAGERGRLLYEPYV